MLQTVCVNVTVYDVAGDNAGTGAAKYGNPLNPGGVANGLGSGDGAAVNAPTGTLPLADVIVMTYGPK